IGFFEESRGQLLGFVRDESVANRRRAVLQKTLYQRVEAVRGFGWGPALGGHGCGHGFEDGAWGFAEGQDQVRSSCIATCESQAHLETAEAALRVCLGGEGDEDGAGHGGGADAFSLVPGELRARRTGPGGPAQTWRSAPPNHSECPKALILFWKM